MRLSLNFGNGTGTFSELLNPLSPTVANDVTAGVQVPAIALTAFDQGVTPANNLGTYAFNSVVFTADTVENTESVPFIYRTESFRPFLPDLQSWIRDASLDPDWLRIGTDIVGGTPAPTFNGAFSLNGVVTPLPGALPFFATGLGVLGLLGWRRKRKAQAL